MLNGKRKRVGLIINNQFCVKIVKIFINTNNLFLKVNKLYQIRNAFGSVYNIRWLRYSCFSCQSNIPGRDVQPTSLDLAFKIPKLCQRTFQNRRFQIFLILGTDIHSEEVHIFILKSGEFLNRLCVTNVNFIKKTCMQGSMIYPGIGVRMKNGQILPRSGSGNI